VTTTEMAVNSQRSLHHQLNETVTLTHELKNNQQNYEQQFLQSTEKLTNK